MAPSEIEATIRTFIGQNFLYRQGADTLLGKLQALSMHEGRITSL